MNTNAQDMVAYFGREQTAVKHRLLQKYLAPAARIIGSFKDCFVYIDCCSGPWQTVTRDYSDASFRIAVEELRKARSDVQRMHGRDVQFRCLFIEQQPEPYARLEQFCKTINDIEVKPMRGDFTEKVPEILRFVNQWPKSFPFFFIDPTGWSPLAISAIKPLLEYEPSEVLINFMTSHIKRFLESSGFETKFSPDYMRKVVGLSGQERDDSAAFSFADEVRKFYRYTSTAVVLNPLRDQTHFHLIYGTRSPKGVDKFKEAEKACFPLMEALRLNAQQRQTALDPQSRLFDASPLHDSYLFGLRSHYFELATDAVQQAARYKPITKDDAWEIASRFPLVWNSDFNSWWESRTPRAGASGLARETSTSV